MLNSIFHRVLVTVLLSLLVLDSVLAECSWDALECPGYRRVCKFGWWTKVIMLAIIAAILAGGAAAGAGGIVGGAIAAIVANVLAILGGVAATGFVSGVVASVLGLFGFLPAGIQAGGFAAWVQSIIGPVRAGSLFAKLQSLAARGVPGSALAADIAKYVAANGLPLSIAQILALDCYWEAIPREDL